MTNRKLQVEIDRTIKKVNEGVELFDEIEDKVYSAQNASQRDKYEGELKKEIKKLQRLREQIRAWISGNEVKDKKSLEDKRKVIETRMEKFKVCEQKTKMKAYSKEALSQKQIQRRKKTKNIPETLEKKEAKKWIKDSETTIEELLEDLDEKMEEERNSRKPDNDEIDKLEKRKKKHNQFIEHLQQIYEFLDDDRLKFEDINEIKDSVEYYIDYNQDPEFVEDDLLFDGLYKKAEEAELAEELEFSDEEDENYDEEDDDYDEEEDEPISPTSPRKRKISDPVPMVKKVETPKKAEPVKQPPSPVKKQPETPKKVEKAPEPVKPVVAPTPVSVPVAQKPPIAPVKQTPPQPQEQPVKKDSKAKQAVAGSNLKVKVPPTQEPVVNTNNATPKSAPVQPSTKQTQPTTPMTAVVDKNKVVPKIAPSPTVKQPLNQPTSNVVKSHVSYMDMVNKTQGAVTTPTSQPTVQINPTQKLSKPESVHMFDPSITGANSDVTILSSKDEELERSEPVTVPLPPSMGIEDFSFRTASTSPHLQQNVFTDADWKNQMLQGSLTHLPHVTDCERPRLYTPLNEFATPDYFPSQPAPILSDPSIFGSMDTDTLFFIFYFKQGTYQQYLAAKELKKQAWRYHKKYMTWFQRHDKPRHTTNEYELGTYVYFDYETGWCQRIKSGFRFEYQHLEDSN